MPYLKSLLLLLALVPTLQAETDIQRRIREWQSPAPSAPVSGSINIGLPGGGEISVGGAGPGAPPSTGVSPAPTPAPAPTPKPATKAPVPATNDLTSWLASVLSSLTGVPSSVTSVVLAGLLAYLFRGRLGSLLTRAGGALQGSAQTTPDPGTVTSDPTVQKLLPQALKRYMGLDQNPPKS